MHTSRISKQKLFIAFEIVKIRTFILLKCYTYHKNVTKSLNVSLNNI